MFIIFDHFTTIYNLSLPRQKKPSLNFQAQTNPHIIMIKSFSKLFINTRRSLAIKMNVPHYTFILGRIFKKNQPQQDPKIAQQREKQEAELYQAEKNRMKRQVEKQNQYDMLQRQKDIELNRDFRSLHQKYKNTIPEDIGKSGFDQLVYWSQNAQTPQQIADMIKKFNKCSRPKTIEDDQTFYQFIENVKATVYLTQNYTSMVDYAHFGYKYVIQEPQFWLKIQQKCTRKPPRTDQEYSQLIDILFVMANVGQGEVIYSSSQKILAERKFTVDQIAKLIIVFFRTQRGQKEWIIKLLVSLEMQMDEVDCDVLESVLPILKHSNNIPASFEDKVQKKIIKLKNQLTHSLICVAASYFGFGKGSQQFWKIMQLKAREHFHKVKQQKGRIPSSMLAQIIPGIMSSYKFSPQYITQLILPQLSQKQFKPLYKLSATTLSTLSKNLYIYQLQSSTQQLEQTIQSLIMRNFQKISQVTNQQLIHVLKDYTVTRLGSREFYLFLEKIVMDKLADIRTEKYTVDVLNAIYQESNLCSTDTLELLKKLAYQ